MKPKTIEDIDARIADLRARDSDLAKKRARVQAEIRDAFTEKRRLMLLRLVGIENAVEYTTVHIGARLSKGHPRRGDRGTVVAVRRKLITVKFAGVAWTMSIGDVDMVASPTLATT